MDDNEYLQLSADGESCIALVLGDPNNNTAFLGAPFFKTYTVVNEYNLNSIFIYEKEEVIPEPPTPPTPPVENAT